MADDDGFIDAVGDVYEWVEDEIEDAVDDVVDVVEDSMLDWMGAQPLGYTLGQAARLALGSTLLFESQRLPFQAVLAAQLFVVVSGYLRMGILAATAGELDLFAYPRSLRGHLAKAGRQGAVLATAAAASLALPSSRCAPAAAGLALGLEGSKTVKACGERAAE